MPDVSIHGVIKARKFVYQFLRPTYLLHYPLVSRYLGCRAYFKHENHHPTKAFKIRGGINLIANLSAEERKAGVITATRGNHGQSIALASRLFGVHCTIGIPEGNNPEKNAAIESFGATLLIHGRDFDDVRKKVEAVQLERNLRYIHSGNEPMLLHGVGTYALEILEDLPEVDVILVPIGGGSGAAATLTVVRTLCPSIEVIGVQAEKAPAFYLSWKKGAPVETDSADTIADGLATRSIFELPFAIIRQSIDDVVTVSEEELRKAVAQIFRMTHEMAEPAAAATLAGAAQLKARLAGKNVVMILSGGNIDSALLREILETEPAGD